MIQPVDLPDMIAVFPLPGALLLPRAKLPLHLFEPRYLQMLDDCLKTPHRLIGMVQPRKNGTGHGLHEVGCAGRLTQFSETDDGRYMITLSGLSRFRVVAEIEGFTPYRRCSVDWEGYDADRRAQPDHLGFDRSALMSLLERYFEARGLSTDWKSMQEADDELLVNSLSMLLDFPPEDKQALLEARELQARLETLTTLLEFGLRSGSPEEKMQ